MNLSKKCKICAQCDECGEKKNFWALPTECGEKKNISTLKTAKIHRFHSIQR